MKYISIRVLLYYIPTNKYERCIGTYDFYIEDCLVMH